MRAAEQAHLSPNRSDVDRVAAVRLTLLRVAVAVFATLALLLIWHPVVLHAQATPPVASRDSATTPTAPVRGSPAGVPKAASSAQQDSTTTHTVKAGETLWSLAVRYFGDGHAWRTIAKRNGIALSSDTALRIGAVLVVPSRRSVVAARSTLPHPRHSTTCFSPALPAIDRRVRCCYPRADSCHAVECCG